MLEARQSLASHRAAKPFRLEPGFALLQPGFPQLRSEICDLLGCTIRPTHIIRRYRYDFLRLRLNAFF